MAAVRLAKRGSMPPGGQELIRITVGKQLARGDHDSVMKRYAARPAGVKR